jgi:hypothetical protein
MATKTIVRLADQASGFLTNQSASLTFLTNATASTQYLTHTSASTVYASKTSPDFINDISIKGTTPELNFLNSSGSVVSTIIHYGAELPGEADMVVTANPTDAYTKSSLYLYAGAAELITNIGSMSSLAAGVGKDVGFTVLHGTNGILLKVDTSGKITMPKVPAFNVYSSFVSTQSGNLTYNATNSNNGGHMNLGTGLFTAPVSGYYHFNYYGFIDTGLSGNTTITFQKNGSGFPSRAYNDFNDTSYGPVITLSAVIYLATNDNVRVNISGAGVHGNDSSFFSGFLIG